jgi:hypothetical protein
VELLPRILEVAPIPTRAPSPDVDWTPLRHISKREELLKHNDTLVERTLRYCIRESLLIHTQKKNESLKKILTPE